MHGIIADYYWHRYYNDWSHCDRYGLRYLPTHLVNLAALEKPSVIAKNYIEKLHKLLTSKTSERRNAWFDAKDAIQDTAGYLADVRLAWKEANEEFVKNKTKSAIALQLRYALIRLLILQLHSIAYRVFAYLC